MNTKNLFRIMAGIGIFSLILSPFSLLTRTAMAATITTFSDTLTRIQASTAANHEIFFVTPTGVASGQTITLTFSADFTGVSSIIEDDVDFASGSTATCTSATYTEQATVPSGASSSQWNVSASGSVITIESGGASATVSSNKCVRIRIGTNATQNGTGANQISSGSADDDDSLVVGGSFGDSGTATIDIIAGDQVTITATVLPTFAFTVDDTAIGFGTLVTSGPRYATADATGSGSDSADANTFTINTNAASGYTLTYSGATLTSGGNTISPATITGDADGTPGSEQFAISTTVTSTGSEASGYDHAGPDWKFTAGSTQTLASHTAPASDSIGIRYLANISATTEPGSYSTTLTYVATGNF